MQESMNDQAAPQSSSAIKSEPIRITRRFNVCIKGSLQNFESEGDGAATWRPLEGKQVDIFAPHEHEGSIGDHASAAQVIQGANIIELKRLSETSTFPIALGVTMNCIPGTEMTENGEKFVCTVLPNSSNTQTESLFKANSNTSDADQWIKNFKAYNANNLETLNVLDVNNTPYVFIHESHPVISLLRMNKELLGTDIDSEPKFEQEWYKVSKQVMSSCCSTLRNKVLPRLNTRDLNSFSVQLNRLDNEPWNSVGLADEAQIGFKTLHTWDGDETQLALQNHMENFLENPNMYMARFEITYELNP